MYLTGLVVLILADRVVLERESKQFQFVRCFRVTLTPNSFDLELPIEVDDEYWQNDDATLAFQQPPGKPALVTSFNCLIKLTQMMEFALTTIVKRAIISSIR